MNNGQLNSFENKIPKEKKVLQKTVNYPLSIVHLIILFSIFSFHYSFAQQPATIDTTKHAPVVITPSPYDTAIHITEGPGVNHSVQKRVEYSRLSQGKFPGYRIQVSFGQDRNDANKLRSDFTLKFPGLPTYLAYQQPYFKIYAGDFRTKLEAMKFIGPVKKGYPGAFIVKDKIYPPPLAN